MKQWHLNKPDYAYQSDSILKKSYGSSILMNEWGAALAKCVSPHDHDQ